MSDSSSSKNVVPLFNIFFILADQATCLSDGNEISRAQVSSFQPRSILVSSRAASAVNLDNETKFSLGMGSSLFVGLPTVCMARSTAAAALSLLSFMSIVTVARSSM